jgi:hypothetical protein
MDYRWVWKIFFMKWTDVWTKRPIGGVENEFDDNMILCFNFRSEEYENLMTILYKMDSLMM